LLIIIIHGRYIPTLTGNYIKRVVLLQAITAPTEVRTNDHN